MDHCYSGSAHGWIGPTGTHWTPSGRGRPSLDELTLTILLDHLGDLKRATRLCQSMKQTISYALPESGGTLTPAEIDSAIVEIESEAATVLHDHDDVAKELG